MLQHSSPKHRRSIRLKDFDYGQAGAYFITICTQDRAHLFGEIINDTMQLNEAGEMIHAQWHAIPERFNNAELDAFVVMPNHIHGIILLGQSRQGRLQESPLQTPDTPRRGEPRVRHEHQNQNRPQGTLPNTLGRIIQAYKSLTTHAYIQGVKQEGWPPFSGKVWQRNYWEHVIRNETELGHLREYIQNNPAKWALDSLNQNAHGIGDIEKGDHKDRPYEPSSMSNCRGEPRVRPNPKCTTKEQ